MESATVTAQRGLQAERISALLDGEVESDELSILLGQAEDDDGRLLWNDYHLIGDALRSDELALPKSESDFLARFSARLSDEPHLLAPAALVDHVPRVAAKRMNPFLRVRRVLPTAAAAAAVAALSWVVVPRLQDHPVGVTPTLMQAAVNTAPQTTLQRVAQPLNATATTQAGQANGDQGDLIVMRDARLDQYLAAHQQYAPAPIGQNASPFMRASAQADD